MIIKERRARILEVIKERKYCTVNYLSQTLCVAPITIRRDLSAMEQSGLITRCFGGASVQNSYALVGSLAERTISVDFDTGNE